MIETSYKDITTGIISAVSIACAVLIVMKFIITFIFVAEPKTFEDTYNKAYEQCLTEQQNNTKITNKEYYCVNYATAKVR